MVPGDEERDGPLVEQLEGPVVHCYRVDVQERVRGLGDHLNYVGHLDSVIPLFGIGLVGKYG